MPKVWEPTTKRIKSRMFFCSVLIPAPASVCTKFSASNAYHNNIDKKEKRDRVTCFSFGISGAACSRNGKFNFRPRRRLCCKSQLGLAELAPASSAAYGILLLGGGLFACTVYLTFIFFMSIIYSFILNRIMLHSLSKLRFNILLLLAVRKSGSEGSLFGGLTGAALMASVSFSSVFHLLGT